MKPTYKALIAALVLFVLLGALFPDFALQIIVLSLVFFFVLKGTLEEKETKKRRVKSV